MVGNVVVLDVVVGGVVVGVAIVVVVAIVVFGTALGDVVAACLAVWDVDAGSVPQAAINSTASAAVTDDLERAPMATPLRFDSRSERATIARAIRPVGAPFARLVVRGDAQIWMAELSPARPG